MCGNVHVKADEADGGRCRSEQHWSLLPLHAIASTVAPAFNIYGGMRSTGGPGGWGPSFPQCVGVGALSHSHISVLRNASIASPRALHRPVLLYARRHPRRRHPEFELGVGHQRINRITLHHLWHDTDEVPCAGGSARTRSRASSSDSSPISRSGCGSECRGAGRRSGSSTCPCWLRGLCCPWPRTEV